MGQVATGPKDHQTLSGNHSLLAQANPQGVGGGRGAHGSPGFDAGLTRNWPTNIHNHPLRHVLSLSAQIRRHKKARHEGGQVKWIVGRADGQ